jgi:muramidase (phage lysozyme)
MTSKMTMSTSPNFESWKKAISGAEGTLRQGNIDYNILYGGGRFERYDKHPDKVISGGRYKSAAAGAYQFMPETYYELQRKYNIPDFSPASQDKALYFRMKERGVDPDKDPITPETVAKLAPEFASFPTLEGKSFYGQPVKSFQDIQNYAGVLSQDIQKNTDISPQESKVKVQNLPKEDQAKLYEMVVIKQLLSDDKEVKDKSRETPVVSVKDIYSALENAEQRGQIEALAEMFAESERKKYEKEQQELLQKRRRDMQKKLDPLASLAYFQAATKAAQREFQTGQPVN